MSKFNWSFSKASVFEDCPRQFQYTHLLKLTKYIKSDNMAIGEGIHAFLEQKALNPELTINECTDIFKEVATSAACAVNISLILDHAFLVNAYFKHDKFITPLEIDGTKMVEYKFGLICNEDVRVNGKIDIVSNKEIVVDYKTSKTYYKNEDISNPLKGKGFQCSTYSAAMMQDFNLVPKLNGFQVILKDGSDVQNLATKFDKSIFDKVKQRYIDIDKQYKFYLEKFGKDKVWPVRNHKYCFFCDFKSRCSRNSIV